MNRGVLLGVSLLVLLGGFAAGALYYRAQKTASVATAPSQTFAPARAMRLGDPAARVILVEFFDPACDTCAEFAPILRDMVEKSGGRVQLVERYAPFHPGSQSVVALLEAARRQDRYWETLDLLFSTQTTWMDHTGANLEKVWTVLPKLGLDEARLRADAADPAIAAVIQEDITAADALGVKQTPEFFVNGKPLPTWGLQQLQDLVASELDAQY